MKKRTDEAPPEASRTDRLASLSGLPTAELEARSAAFQRALNRKGLPTTFGVGKGPTKTGSHKGSSRG